MSRYVGFSSTSSNVNFRKLNPHREEETELVIELLYSLDGSCVSCKSLFGILQVLPVLNLSKCGRNHIESMIDSQLNQATLDNLLVPAQTWMDSLYDVNLVQRFLKYFLNAARPSLLISRLKCAAKLINLYMAEIAPDPYLNLSKFITVITVLPDSARDSHDAIYRAIDMHLQIHTRLLEEEKKNICCAINFEKLSSESCKHLANNTKFPSRIAIQALVSQQSKLKWLFQDGGWYKLGAHGLPKGNKCEDMEALLGTYVMGISEAEAFSERLKRELLALEAANVHALIESEPLIEHILHGLDASTVCVGDMDDLLGIFNVKLRHMREDIQSIESRNNKLEMHSVNNKVLMEELDNLLKRLCIRCS